VQTVATDVEFLEESEVGDIWRQSTDLIVAESQFAQFLQSEQTLQRHRESNTLDRLQNIAANNCKNRAIQKRKIAGMSRQLRCFLNNTKSVIIGYRLSIKL